MRPDDHDAYLDSLVSMLRIIALDLATEGRTVDASLIIYVAEAAAAVISGERTPRPKPTNPHEGHSTIFDFI